MCTLTSCWSCFFENHNNFGVSMNWLVWIGDCLLSHKKDDSLHTENENNKHTSTNIKRKRNEVLLHKHRTGYDYISDSLFINSNECIYKQTLGDYYASSWYANLKRTHTFLLIMFLINVIFFLDCVLFWKLCTVVLSMPVSRKNS